MGEVGVPVLCYHFMPIFDCTRTSLELPCPDGSTALSYDHGQPWSIFGLPRIITDGPLRPDHGRMIWGESGKPGFGLYDRALGATYLLGIWEAISRAAVPA